MQAGADEQRANQGLQQANKADKHAAPLRISGVAERPHHAGAAQGRRRHGANCEQLDLQAEGGIPMLQ